MGWKKKKKEQGRLGHNSAMMGDAQPRWRNATTTMRTQKNTEPDDAEIYEMEDLSRIMTKNKNNNSGAGPATEGENAGGGS